MNKRKEVLKETPKNIFTTNIYFLNGIMAHKRAIQKSIQIEKI